jgi:iron(III) transport system ATP-binding protein
MVNLEIKDLTKVYNKKTVLDNISFEVKDGEFLSILGPSGCGKTTLLKILIGIENPTSGRILKKEKDITKLDSSKRGMGIVFQNYALFPNMTVLDNVMYALNLKLKNKEEAKKEALKMIKVVNMEEHIKKYPHELSGGQQQRVAIARTLALNPDIILFDEPMSALDADNRLGLRKELKDIQKKFKTTMIYITHDQEEAFSLSDRVMVMNNGKIEQIDVPNKIFNHPKNDYVRNFVTNHLIEKVSSIEKCTGIDL